MKKSQIKALDPISKILSADNKENIVLFNEDGEPVEFEQIAVIPLEQGDTQSLHVILRPAKPMPGVKDDEALVFDIDEDMNALILTDDEAVVDKVFEEYYELLAEAGVFDQK